MKKILTGVIAGTLAIGCAFSMAACGGEKNISVIGRTSGSGTRDAFESIVKSEEGVKLSDTGMVKSALAQDKTSTVVSLVSSTKTAIGYVSLGSVDSTVKALKINGVEATSATVLDGTYKMQRPFVIMTNKTKTENSALTEATQDFLNFLQSTTAQEIVVSQEYVEQEQNDYVYNAPAETLTGTIVIKGSTSVDPLMDQFIAKYKEIGGSKVSGVEFDKDCQGSAYGIAAAKADTTGNVIGLNSSAVKAADESSLAYFTVALDAIAVIVHKENTLDNITIPQLYDIYTGKIVKFSELNK